MQAGINSCGTGTLFACLMGGAMLCAQQPTAIQRESGVYTYHADTHLVLLDVTATDKQQHPVTGLKKQEFSLSEDQQPQTINVFEEHAPIDAAEIARQKAAAMAGQPPNTFTSYEPFTGRPVTVLLLNQLYPMPANGLYPLHQRMLDFVHKAPPDTQFTVYLLDSKLRLVQPITTDRNLLLARINEIWTNPHFGSEKLINPKRLPAAADIPVRRRITSDAMQQLASDLKAIPGRKNLFVFTGNFACVVAGNEANCPGEGFQNDTKEESKDYLCGLMDTLEQGRISGFRFYQNGNIAYGFGCRSGKADQKTILDSSAYYYSLYYSPTNRDWDGKYRATKVEVTDREVNLAYRKGYYATPENTDARYYIAKPSSAPLKANSGEPSLTATPVTSGTPEHPESAETAKAASNPAAAIFNVQVIPADAVNSQPVASHAKDQKNESREYTLHFTMPAGEFKVTPSDTGSYAAHVALGAVSYADGKQAYSGGSQMMVNFNGAQDPRIAKSTITGTLKLNIPEHGGNRWLYVSVRDVATGQSGSLVIPMEQIRMPTPQ